MTQGVCFYLLILVPGQLPDVLLRRRVAVTVADGHGPHGRVGHLSHGHRELHVAVLFQLLGYLVVRGEGHVAH